MLTSSSSTSGRGGLTLTASALGLALAIGGGVAVARTSSDEGAPVDRAVTAPADQPEPFVVEPDTSLDPEPSAPVERSRPEAHPAKGTPQRIVVPTLGVDSPIVRIDAPGGVLIPPDDPQVLGWWQSGAKPGAKFGSALITGHTVSSGGGAFDDLDTLRTGDRVTIRTTEGQIAYRVTGVTIYRKASLAKHSRRVFSQDVPGRIVLITCEDWNGSIYLSNAVVTAVPVDRVAG